MGRNRAPDPHQPDLFSILDEAGGDGDRSGNSEGGADGLRDRSGPTRGVDPGATQPVPDGRSGQDQLDGGQHGRGTVGESHRGLESQPQRQDTESRDQGGTAGSGPGAGSPDSAEQRTLRADRDRRDPATVGDTRPDSGPGSGRLAAALDQP